VQRARSADDKRSFFVRLTPAGERTFHDVFPRVVARGGAIFAHFTEEDYAALEKTLSALKTVIIGGSPATHDTTKENI
jgi:DNA-binding MarR family transcriptional regulator